MIGPATCTGMGPIAGLLSIQIVVIVVDGTKCCLSVRLTCLFYVCVLCFVRFAEEAESPKRP